MIEPKISITFTLPGSVMVSKLAAACNPKKCLVEETLKVIDYQSKGLSPIYFYTRKSKPAKQVLKASKETYEAMLAESTSNKYNKIVAKIKGRPIRVWDTMSEDARIRKHCELIAHDMNAIDFDFIVFDD